MRYATPGEALLVDLPPFRFFEHRSGSGTPVVLIHGLGGSADWWLRNFDDLAREHLVVAVDLVRKARVPRTLSEIGTLLTRWIETSFIEPVHLVGNSMGGHIAIHVAAQRPDLVRSLTLVNSTGIPFELAPGAHVSNLIVPTGAFSFGRILARDAFRSGPTSIAMAFAGLLRDDARALITGLRIPTLILWGERDPLVPLKYGEQIAEMIPGARLVRIPHAGHIPMWENAEAFNTALLDFLRDVNRQPAAAVLAPQPFTWSVAGWTNGIAHRQSGRDPRVVLVHGLGMSSRYFKPFAEALHARGLPAIAPDLPGFGQSADGPPAGPAEHAEILARWAEAARVRDAVWIGHSIGCNAVAHLARLRPDLCRDTIMIGPLWTRQSLIRLLGCLIIDVFREPRGIVPYVITAYWRCGLGRWFATFRRYARDIRANPPATVLLAGARDPLPDRTHVRVIDTPGAHACHVSHPEEVADHVVAARPT